MKEKRSSYQFRQSVEYVKAQPEFIRKLLGQHVEEPKDSEKDQLRPEQDVEEREDEKPQIDEKSQDSLHSTKRKEPERTKSPESSNVSRNEETDKLLDKVRMRNKPKTEFATLKKKDTTIDSVSKKAKPDPSTSASGGKKNLLSFDMDQH